MQLIIVHGGTDAKELKDLVARKMDEALKALTLLKGRQIVFLLLENFKTFDSSEMVYGFGHLVKCECGTDLSAFLTQWQKIFDNMCAAMPTVNLRDVFYRKIKHVEQLKQDMNKYERFYENDKNKTYEWLLGIVQQEIRLQRQSRNTADREQLMMRSPPAKAKPAASAEDVAPAKTPKAAAKSPEQKESEKVATQLRKELATMTEELALANLAGKGEGNVASAKSLKGKGVKGEGKGKTPCYYFHHAECVRGDKCYFSHAVISKEDKAKLAKPVSRSTSPSSWTADPKSRHRNR